MLAPRFSPHIFYDIFCVHPSTSVSFYVDILFPSLLLRLLFYFSWLLFMFIRGISDDILLPENVMFGFGGLGLVYFSKLLCYLKMRFVRQTCFYDVNFYGLENILPVYFFFPLSYITPKIFACFY